MRYKRERAKRKGSSGDMKRSNLQNSRSISISLPLPVQQLPLSVCSELSGASGAASLAVVAPGIAESLIATAAGLAAAIPAVIAYNYYLSMARRMIIDMEDFSEELLDFFTKENL
jgi:hypothetical protein